MFSRILLGSTIEIAMEGAFYKLKNIIVRL